MANAPLTDAEIQEIKQRLGYGSMTALALPYIETALLFETVIQQNVNDYGIGYIRNTVLPNLRQLESDIFTARARLKALRVGSISSNPDEIRKLERQEQYWLRKLSSTVRVQIVAPPGEGGSDVELR